MINLEIMPDVEIEIDNIQYDGGWLCNDTYVLSTSNITIKNKTKVVIDRNPYRIKTITIINGYVILELILA